MSKNVLSATCRTVQQAWYASTVSFNFHCYNPHSFQNNPPFKQNSVTYSRCLRLLIEDVLKFFSSTLHHQRSQYILYECQSRVYAACGIVQQACCSNNTKSVTLAFHRQEARSKQTFIRKYSVIQSIQSYTSSWGGGFM